MPRCIRRGTVLIDGLGTRWSGHKNVKCVFSIGIETWHEYGSAVKVIVCIEDPVVIRKILDHLREKPK